MEVLTIVLISIIVFLVIALAVAIYFVFRERDIVTPPINPTTCSLSYSFPSFANTEFDGTIQPLYNDTQSINGAQSRCTTDPNCASFINYQGTNYYYPSASQTFRVSGPGTTLYVKQPQCS